eukprot:2345009-Amphidinium_carterae.1
MTTDGGGLFDVRLDVSGKPDLLHPGEPSWATCSLQSLVLLSNTSEILRQLGESEDFERSVGTTSRMNRKTLMSVFLSPVKDESEQVTKARRETFQMLIACA